MFLKFENFNGVPEFSGEIDNRIISGKNKAGKTTILSAVMWILTGYDLDLSDTPKVQQDGKFLDLATKAELEFNGMKIGRTYSEKWVKNRQTLEKEFKGNETGYFLNGDAVSQAEFNKFLETYKMGGLKIRDSIFSFMIPGYFAKILDEKDRASVVYDNIGKVSISEIAERIGMPELAEWYESLKDPDKERATMVTACNDLAKERDTSQAKCEEKRKDSMIVLPDLDDLKEEQKKIENEVAKLDNIINNDSVKTAKLRIETEKRDFISKFNKKKSDYENAESKKRREKEEKENEKRTEIIKANEETEKRYKAKNEAYESAVKAQKELAEKIAEKEKAIEGLRSDFISEKSKVFSGTLCPVLKEHCEVLKDSPDIQKLESDHNLAKSKKLEEINNKGVALKEEIESLKSKLTEPAKPDLEKLVAVPERKTFEVKPFEEVCDTSEFDRKLEELKEKKDDKTAELEKKSKLTERLTEIQQDIFRHDQKLKDLKRVGELEKESGDLADRYKEKQKMIAFIHQFNIKKAEMLEGDAERVFGFKIKLYDFQINGTPKNICRFLDKKGVEFSSVNNADQVNMGMKHCETLQELYGVNLPVLVDNTESVNSLEKISRVVVATKVTTESLIIEKM